MKPIKFKECNITFAEDQPPYQPLPAYRAADGEVVTCWAMSCRERLKVLWTGQVWLGLWTFNRPLQPQYLSVTPLVVSLEMKKMWWQKTDNVKYTCTRDLRHEHRWRWSAWLCGKVGKALARRKKVQGYQCICTTCGRNGPVAEMINHVCWPKDGPAPTDLEKRLQREIERMQ
jgi:hypothetical protein